jgi:hypothetical protein
MHMTIEMKCKLYIAPFSPHKGSSHLKKFRQALIERIGHWHVVWGLALGIALVAQWHERQWQVPKAWVGIFLGCRAVGNC